MIRKLELASLQLFEKQNHKLSVRTDKLFGFLLLFEWVAAIMTALLFSPLEWSGASSAMHVHVVIAVIVGGALTLFPISLMILKPGSVVTRQIIAVSQMLFSCLFTHLSGGRIETHFHIFGSLALLAFYRDWRVLATASVVVATDHFIRGWFYPQSIFGLNFASPWRAFEHCAWVVFEDVFLLLGISQSVAEMHELAANTAQLECKNDTIESQVLIQTSKLLKSEVELTRLVAVIQQSGDAIISMDLDNIIRSWNSGAERLWRFTAVEMKGQRYDPPLPVTIMKYQRALIDKVKNGETVGNVETITAMKGGGFVDVALTLSPVRSEGGDIVAVGIVARDITEKKLAEKRISEFYSVISHELRTPLTSIRGSLALIANGVVAQDSIEATQLIEIAQKSTLRLVHLVNEILDLRKIEADDFELEMREITASELVETSISAMQGFAAEHNVYLRSSVKSELCVNADGDRIVQVLCNLISNAIKYSPAGAFVDVTAMNDTGIMRFSVADTGSGIPDDFLPRLFGKFQQYDSSDARAKEGSGLGLAISKAIIERHGGSLKVESAPWVKTVFGFDIGLAVKEPVLVLHCSPP